MVSRERIEELNAFTDDLFGYGIGNALASVGPRLDVSKPNIHNNKTEFLREKGTVEQIIKHLNAVLDQFVDPKYHDDTEHDEMMSRLNVAIDKIGREGLPRRELQTASHLALNNLVDTGLFANSLFMIISLERVYRDRLDDLNDQEIQFWSATNRPPNHYARTIALRFARVFAREKRMKPTFGIAREGNHPSTDYGRALEHVFSILKIKAKVRSPAEWAIGQLNEADWNPPVKALMGSLLSAGPNELDMKASITTKERIAEMLAKGNKP